VTESFFLCFVYLLALYGLILLTCQIARLFRSRAGASPYASLLFIVRNQAPVIEGLVRNILSFYHTLIPSFELIVVDDASSDETPQILQRLSRVAPFQFIWMEEHCPGGKPLEVGLRACRGEVICYFHLTGEVHPRLITRLAARLIKGEAIQAPFEHCAVTLVKRGKPGGRPGTELRDRI
jgi:cellulose synthase/poly-beta-1,6-N-acetylglucosamine synthase-like glycosyltransferase